jgi:hypothetical protein
MDRDVSFEYIEESHDQFELGPFQSNVTLAERRHVDISQSFALSIRTQTARRVRVERHAASIAVHDEAVYSAGRTLPEEFSRKSPQIILAVALNVPRHHCLSSARAK